MKKKLSFLATFVFLPLLLVSCDVTNGSLVVANGGEGASSIAEVQNGRLANPGEPTRDDGAAFLGWYTSYNFDESTKIDFSKEIKDAPEYVIAKWDKQYIFSLNFWKQGLYGKKDDVIWEYWVPAGKYKAVLKAGDTTSQGWLKVQKNSGYTKDYGWPTARTIHFKKTDSYFEFELLSTQHIWISMDSIFLLTRTDVDAKYTVPFDGRERLKVSDVVLIAILSTILAALIVYIVWLIIKRQQTLKSQEGKNLISELAKTDYITFKQLSEKTSLTEKQVKKLLLRMIPIKIGKDRFRISRSGSYAQRVIYTAPTPPELKDVETIKYTKILGLDSQNMTPQGAIVGGILAGPVGAAIGALASGNANSVTFIIVHKDGTKTSERVIYQSKRFNVLLQYLEI